MHSQRFIHDIVGDDEMSADVFESSRQEGREETELAVFSCFFILGGPGMRDAPWQDLSESSSEPNGVRGGTSRS